MKRVSFCSNNLLRALVAVAATCFAAGTSATVIQAEDYAWYYDTTPGNAGGQYRQDDVDIEGTSDSGGGYNVGWTESGEWLAFQGLSIPSSGEYKIRARVASAGGGALSFDLNGGNIFLGQVNVPATGGWQNWTTVEIEVYINAGTYDFGVFAVTGGWNLNWVEITGGTTNPPGGGLTAAEAAANMGAGFNLGQMFDNTQHPRTFAAAKQKIDAYYNMGYRNVRIPITWTAPVGGNTLVYDPNIGNVNFGHSRLNEIKQTVDYALSLSGMYVVINAHHEKDLKTYNRWWVLERLWQDITAIFSNRDHRLMFEILNEPHLNNSEPMPVANLRFMTSKAYNKIRVVDPQRIVIIGGNQWFNANEMAQVWPNLNEVGGGQDPYVMATFHHYSPWSFSGSNQGDYADYWDGNSISGPMDVMRNWADSVGNGMPVYIGEWGVGWGSRYTTMECNNIRRWYQHFHGNHAKSRGMPTSTWDDGGWFKVFDHGTGTFANNLATCLITGVCAWTGGDRFNSACY